MKRLTLFLAATLLMAQCASGDLSVVEPLKFKQIKGTKSMAKVVDEISAMTLERPGDLVVGQINKVVRLPNGGVAMSVNYSDRHVLLFDGDGAFVRSVTDEGYLEGEMRVVTDIAVDYRRNRLFVMDALNKVLIYDAATGEFIERIKPQWSDRTYRLDGLVTIEGGGGFSVVSSNTATRRTEAKRKVVTTFSNTGGERAQWLETDDYMIDRSLVLQSYDNSYILRAFDSRNTIYEFVDGVPRRLYDVDFGKRSAPAHLAYDSSGVLRFDRFFRSDFYKFVNNVTLTPRTMSFVASGPEGSSAHYVYDRESGRGVRFAARDGKTFPAPFVMADNNFHYAIFDKRSTADMHDRADVLTRYLVEQLGVLPAEEWCKLVGVKFKGL